MLILHGVIGAETRRAAAAALSALEPSPLGAAARLRIIEAGPLALLASETASSAAALSQRLETIEGASALAAAHNRLLSALIVAIDVLPARLSGAFETEAALLAHVARQRDALGERLRRVAGAAEYSARLSTRPMEGARAQGAGSDGAGAAGSGAAGSYAAGSPAAGSRAAELGASGAADDVAARDGRRYLQSRLSKRRSHARRREDMAALSEEMIAAARALARETVLAKGPTERRPQLRLDLALLLERGAESRLAAFGARFEAPARALGLELALIGPWAPFSFTGAPEETAPEPPLRAQHPSRGAAPAPFSAWGGAA
ncbi:MAG: GvpL/GvpF family gas vesicle protein [Pseudomonadota bacterium]